MSILIKGMDMPTDCEHCRFAVDGWCYAYGKPNIAALSNKERTSFCPLVPVPPHGRLIDADALFPMYADLLDGRDVQPVIPKIVIDTAPTIIEAEGEE